MKWSLDLLEHVADNGHMDALAIVDTMGVLAPHTVPYLVKAVKARIPGKPVELHFHDDYGLGAANTIMGLAAGADVAHTTIGAVGERAGNAPYEDVVLSLLTLYGCLLYTSRGKAVVWKRGHRPGGDRRPGGVSDAVVLCHSSPVVSPLWGGGRLLPAGAGRHVHDPAPHGGERLAEAP